MADLRRNIVTGDLVLVAGGREARPRDISNRNTEPAAPALDPDCPLCPGNESRTPPSILELPAGAGGRWQVRVVANKYSALAASGSDDAPEGSQEVVVESRRHNASPFEFARTDLYLALSASRERCQALMASPSVEYVLPFKNHGPASGASLVHPHSQIAALTFVPPQVARRAMLAEEALSRDGVCPVCRLVTDEIEADVRVVSTNSAFAVLEPYASSFPAETWIVPRTHQASFAETKDTDLNLFADTLCRALRSLGKAYGEPSFNHVVHSSPRELGVSGRLHWYLQIIPRLTTPGGFEFGTATMINEVPPEQSAAALREAWPREDA